MVADAVLRVVGGEERAVWRGVASGGRAGSGGRGGGVVRRCCALSSAMDGLVREVVLLIHACHMSTWHFKIGFRLMYACHRSTYHFQYWLSSHSCLSQKHIPFSILAFVSFMLAT